MFKKVKRFLTGAKGARDELEGAVDALLALVATDDKSEGNQWGGCQGCWECRHAEECKNGH